MVKHGLSRRALLSSAAMLVTLPGFAQAAEVIDLGWNDLLPEGGAAQAPSVRGIVQHEDAPLASLQPESTGVRTDWDGQTVRLPGYMVPIDYDGSGVVTFILVPYVGACIHVPPPPANQLVLVTTERPYETQGLFEAVNVTGVFASASASTELADIGYTLSAGRIEPYS